MKPLILALSFCLLACVGSAHARPVFRFENADTSFLMAVEDAFFVSGSGIVVTGTIESGTAIPGMKVEIRGGGNKVFTATIGFISMYTKQVGSAKKGDAIGLNLKGVEKEDIKRGMVVTAPNTIQSYTEIEVSLSLLPTDKGGLSSALKNDQLVLLLSRTEMVSAHLLTSADLKPGETATVKIKLATATAFRLRDKIAIKYLGKVVGNGVINKLD